MLFIDEVALFTHTHTQTPCARIVRWPVHTACCLLTLRVGGHLLSVTVLAPSGQYGVQPGRRGGREWGDATQLCPWLPAQIVSQLLRFLEGFNGTTHTTVVFGTNRLTALDPALLSRTSAVVHFPLPNLSARTAIWALYAKQLSASERAGLAAASEGLSGRDIKKVAEGVERRACADAVRAGTKAGALRAPQFAAYQEAVSARLHSLAGFSDGHSTSPVTST